LAEHAPSELAGWVQFPVRPYRRFVKRNFRPVHPRARLWWMGANEQFTRIAAIDSPPSQHSLRKQPCWDEHHWASIIKLDELNQTTIWTNLAIFSRFDVSVTSALIETVKKTISTWRRDYVRVKQVDQTKPGLAAVKRARQPYVPYLLRNLTGCTLHFATQTAAVQKSDITSSRMFFASTAHRMLCAIADFFESVSKCSLLCAGTVDTL